MLKQLMGVFALLTATIAISPAQAASDPEDMAGSKDPAQFTRMPNFYIYNYQNIEFDRVEFPVGPGKIQPVEGHHVTVHYYGKQGVKYPSPLQIVRNYENAAKAIGGKTIFEDNDGGYSATLNIIKNNMEIWAVVHASIPGDYEIDVVEKQLMNQEVVADAKSMAGSLRETGKVAIYGIYFDNDKADIKPQSEPSIAEIVKLLKGDAKLKVYVVGHTDNAGGFDHNIKLSQARAASVVNALASRGIATGRMTPYGVGPVAPVAANNTDAGRAKNRRVELVQQ